MASQKISGTGWSGRVGPSGKVIGRTVDSSPAGLRKWARSGATKGCRACAGDGREMVADGRYGSKPCPACKGSGERS
jgi:DnaJ-class molecular chaperone